MTAMTDDTLPVTPRTIRDEMIAFGIMTALLLIVPLTGVYPFFVMQALCFALLACAFNLLIGYGGLLSFGHAMFLGTAGYISAHALKVWGFTPELGILAGTVGAAGLGVITGIVAIRRQGIYFAMITLALAQMVMDAKLKVRLRVLIPAVENAVAGNAFRPLDIFKSRKGPTVEIGNTDAEGRLILADALALADEEAPDLIVDFSTLTGAARVALGPELPAALRPEESGAATRARVRLISGYR